MLREGTRIRQIPGRPRRRWFESDRFDLIVWTSDAGAVVGVQLCYDKDSTDERAVTWIKGRELTHYRVDDGEGRPGRYKMTPILTRDGTLDGPGLVQAFVAASGALERDIVDAVVEAITRLAADESAIVAIDHVQLAMPAGGEEAARRFYAGLLGIPERPKPAALAARGGTWFERNAVRIHLGVEADFRPARKAHPALQVRGLEPLVARLRAAGVEVIDEPLHGHRRVYVADPFGNRLELLEPLP